jgi:hypothetical protein
MLFSVCVVAKITSFGVPQTLLNHGFWNDIFVSGDIDNDGRTDIVYDYLDSNLIISTHMKGIRKDTRLYRMSKDITALDIGDADQDGDNDILVGAIPSLSTQKKLYYLVNTSNGTWGDTAVIPVSSAYIIAAVFADIDNDKDKDIVTLSCSKNDRGLLQWHELSGGAWITHDIDTAITNGTTYSNVYWLKTADFNNDSLVDIVCGIDGDMDRLIKFTNSVNKQFTKSFIAGNYLGTPSGAVGDINFDGYCDIFTGKQWYQNVNGTSFIEKDITNPPQYNADDVAIGDVNNDGYPDFAAATYNEGVYVWQNNGDMTFTRTLLFNTAGAKKIIFADVNSDGFTDVVYRNDTRPKVVEWIQNTAMCAFERKVIFSDPGLCAFDKADIDMDGDLDFFLYSRVRQSFNYSVVISAMENVGSGQFTKRYKMNTSYVSLIPELIILNAADVDNDMGQDMIIQAGALQWNKQTDINTFTMHGIGATGDSLKRLQVLDFDGDGDVDIFGFLKTNRYSETRLYTNDGKGVFSVTIVNVGTKSGNACHLNNDKYGDIITHSQLLNGKEYAVVHLNKGDGTYSKVQVENSDQLPSDIIKPVDLDNDGDIDIVVASIDSSRFGWYENLGDTNSDGLPDYSAQVTCIGASKPAGVDADDIDKDGRIDILLYCSGDSSLSWMKQGKDKEFVSRIQIVNSFSIGQPRFIDYDKDGWVDILGIESDKLVLYRNLLGAPKATVQPPVAANKKIPDSKSVNAVNVRLEKGSITINVANKFEPGSHIDFMLLNGRTVYRAKLDGIKTGRFRVPQNGTNLLCFRITNGSGIICAEGRCF